LEDAAVGELEQTELDNAVTEATEGAEVSEESDAPQNTETVEEESLSDAEFALLQIADEVTDAESEMEEIEQSATEEGAEDEVADDMSESPALVDTESEIQSDAEAEAMTLHLHIAEDADSFLALAEEVDVSESEESESEEESDEDETADDMSESPALIDVEEAIEDGDEDVSESDSFDEAEFDLESASEETSDSDPYVSFAEVFVNAPLGAVTSTAQTEEQADSAADAAEDAAVAEETETVAFETSAGVDDSSSDEMVINESGEGVWQDIQRDTKPQDLTALNSESWDAIQADTKPKAVTPNTEALIASTKPAAKSAEAETKKF
jgi:hypothetical protein